MSTNVLHELAHANFQKRKQKTYPGRVIMIGLDPTGKFLVQFYAIMGRSSGSRERHFWADQFNRLQVLPLDPNQLTRPGANLIFYRAMDSLGDTHVVTNGNHTQDIIDGIGRCDSLFESLRERKYEEDPSATCRIAGVCSNWKSVQTSKFYVLRKSPFGDGCDRLHYQYDSLQPGFGHIISTYVDDGEPLPPWQGEPDLMPVEGEPDEIFQAYQDMLAGEHLVACALKVIDVESGKVEIMVANKYAPLVS
ncbi:MAG: IMP cyclohydrolase [Patescibacteria group bacterium]|jgi:IMP cyclohydrolase